MRRALGFGLLTAGLVGLAGCGGSVAGGAPARQTAVAARQAPEQAKSGSASGWIGQQYLRLSFFGSMADGRYGDQDVRLDLFFGDRVRGNVGERAVELTNFNGQIHGRVGKHTVFATYYNGHVSAWSGSRHLSLSEFGRGFSGWIGQQSVHVSWLRELSTIEKVGVLAVIMTEMTPEQP